METGTTKTSETMSRDSRRAVIDIGSNSVRLVVYDGPPRAPVAICNEKSLCGLGRDMTEDGMLNPSSVEDALMTLARFRHVLDDLGNPPVRAIATSAVREAHDGPQFVEAARALGFDVDVVSGKEEGELAALGVLSVEPNAAGLVGDMGGGSLELAVLNNGTVKDRVSLPIGPLSLMHDVGSDFKLAQKIIDKHLSSVKFIKPGAFDTLYSVGGAWRAVARIHMSIRGYPLQVLQRYEMTVSQTIEVCDLIARQSRKSLEEIDGIPRRRLDTLPFAATVLKTVLKSLNIKKVVVSSGGVREGLLYQQLSKTVRKQDPFHVASKFYAARLSPDPAFGEVAYQVLEPLFSPTNGAHQRLRYGASLLCDIGAYFHPELRGRHAFDTALRSPFVGVTHVERLWLALALFHRHQGRSVTPPNEQALSLLSDEERNSAVQYGSALRFITALAPKSPSSLEGCSLEQRGDEIIFRAPNDRQALMGETPRRRFVSLAAAFDANAAEVYDD
ncbi:Ppx/GppA phosphatase family protein [Hyphococcus lacteus]|uniref:Ppx/GppA family phosphatase n=1 Tax=Hyphococcus lacteus TaxID=3143536 RepID=A0ABV3Z575_9PROT